MEAPQQPAQPAAEAEEQGAPQARTVALCVSQWNHPTTFYAFTFLRQYILRRAPPGGGDAMHPADNLLIVRVGKKLDESERWKIGGPLIPDVDTALKNYPHQIVNLQGSIQSKMRSFTEEHNIDMVVVGDEFPQSGFKLTSVTDWVKDKVTCPFIIIRPEAVRNVRMRINSNKDSLSFLGTPEGAGGSLTSGAGSAAAAAGSTTGLEEGRVPSPLSSHNPRKICIAYNKFYVGQHLIEKAKQLILEPDDTVYVAHSFEGKGPKEWLHPSQMMKQAGKLAKSLTFQRGSSRDLNTEVTPDNSIDFGAKELEEYNVVLNVVLRGDPRQALERFCESEGIDLLVIGTRAGGKLRKTLTGGSVSGYLIDRAPCPCLTIPYKAMGLVAEASGEEDAGVAGLSPRSGPSSPYFGDGMGSFLSTTFGFSSAVDAATQTEGTASPSQAVSVAQTLEVGSPSAAAGATSRDAGTGVVVAAAEEAGAAGGAAPAAGAPHSTPSDMLSVLREQLEEKDRQIAELRAQVQRLQLAQAESREAQTHDPTRGVPSY